MAALQKPSAPVMMPPWYQTVENWLTPSWPIMVALALTVIIVTVALVLYGHALPLAAWLTYLYMP